MTCDQICNFEYHNDFWCKAAVWKGGNEYDIYLIGYGYKRVPGERGEIQLIWTVEGVMTLDDCYNKHDLVSLNVYDASADADGDGFPDEGAVRNEEASVDGITLSAAKRVR